MFSPCLCKSVGNCGMQVLEDDDAARCHLAFCFGTVRRFNKLTAEKYCHIRAQMDGHAAVV